MNRTLKRPMFRIGGSAGTGITSGLNQPQKMANGGRTGYNQGSMPSFQASGLPGFLTGFGLNLLATPPQGNIFQTSAIAARDPFNQLQVSQAAARKTAEEREFLKDRTTAEQEFLTGERIAGDEAAMERLQLKLDSDERLKGMDDPLYDVMLSKYIDNDLPPQVAKRAATFSTQKADELRSAVKNRYGGVLQFDIRDSSNQKLIKKNLKGKVVYDPFEDNYKYIVVRDGEVFFDEFNSIADIKFPTIGAEETKQQGSTQNFGDTNVFSPRIEDAQP